MSTRNRRQITVAQIKKATAAAANNQFLTNNKGITGKKPESRPQRSKYLFAVVGIGLLLAVGVLGATITGFVLPGRAIVAADDEHESGEPKTFAFSLNGLTGSQPLPSPTPYLDRQNIYAGGKLIAVETAGVAPNTSPTASDLVVWRVSSGVWYIKDGADGTVATNQFGMSSDIPVPADFDGDNLADFCVVRPNTPSAGLGIWYIQPNGSTTMYSSQFGIFSNTAATDDKPAPADYDGDGRADIAVWRPSNKTFYILLSSSSVMQIVQMTQLPGAQAQAADKPVSADYDGDGLADAAVWQNSSGNWFIVYAATGQAQTVQLGLAGDSPAPGDYDGDGRIDQSVWRASNNTWYYKSSVSGQTVTSQVLATQAGDRAVAGDYDGDGKTDMAVWRSSTGYWHIWKSRTNTLRSEQWGQAGDVPVPAPMKR